MNATTIDHPETCARLDVRAVRHAYAKSRSEILVLLAEISDGLQTHSERYADGSTFGAVGDLGYVRAMLSNVHEFIRP